MNPKTKPKKTNSKNQHRWLDELRKQGKLGKGRKPLVRADSAGGVVFAKVDGELKFLLIQHAFNHHWSIPKGYVEPDEPIEEAAVREVYEETGVKGEIVEFLGKIDIYTTHAEHRMHRKLHAYLMRTESAELHPDLFDPEEGMIGDAAWFTPNQALKKIAYKNLHSLVLKAKRRTKELAHG